jgi:class 3 adenylate cyclase/pimeloyl-ACP methyl ester carboxylesterase
VRIAYSARGRGEAIIWQSLFLAQMLAGEEGYERRLETNFIDRGMMVVRFDPRGVGLSQRNLNDFSLEARVQDLAAVVKALRLKSFDLVGQMWSGPVAVAYAVQNPRRIRHLILSRTYARAADITTRERWQPLVDLARTNWRMAAEIFAGIDNPNRSDEQIATNRLLGEGVNGDDAARWLAQQYEVDVRELLPRIKRPTLVLNSRDDRSIRFELGRDLAARIPGAKFVEPRGRGQELSEQIMAAISEFIGLERATKGSTRGGALRTVLFTDLVGHTEMMSRLGDEKGREVLREHERITREVLKAHGGTEVKTMGDGFMASFGSVTKAVECAVALQRAVEEWNAGVGARQAAPLRVRCGLNAGEPIEEDGDLFGATVILASRIAAKAEGGEILVSDNVRSLCAGKGFLFADRGEFVAKGFEEPVRVYEVRWRG